MVEVYLASVAHHPSAKSASHCWSDSLGRWSFSRNSKPTNRRPCGRSSEYSYDATDGVLIAVPRKRGQHGSQQKRL